MIFYCVKTGEYLADILDRVSRGAEYYLQLDLNQDKAESLISKWSERYMLEQSARQRTYRLKTYPVVDLIVIQTQSMAQLKQMRLCLLVTLPQQYRNNSRVNDAQNRINEGFQLDKAQYEGFTSIYDRKQRLTFNTVLPLPLKTTAVYELVELPYTKVERKQKEISKDKGWTWRLHKDFIKLKLGLIEDCYKDAQRIKDTAKQDIKILRELEKLWGMSGFRAVRDDIFKINRKLHGLSFKYLNRKSTIELKVPSYTRKSCRTVHSLSEMRVFYIH